jgi:hypothetical protein
MASCLERIHGSLLSKVENLVGGVSGIKKVATIHFDDAQSISTILEKTRIPAPGAALSFPSVTYPQGQVRALDMELSWMLLVSVPVREDDEKRAEFYFRLHEALMAELFGAKLPGLEDLPASVGFVRPTSSAYGEIGGVGAVLTGFNVTVKNWDARDPDQ